MSNQLTDLPEELLERILSLALAPSSSVWSTPPSAFSTTAPPHILTRSSSAPFATSAALQSTLRKPFPPLSAFALRPPVPAYAPLLVCRCFLRIGTPLLYDDLRLTSPAQVGLVLRTLHARPTLASCVRNLRVEGVWACVLDLIRALSPIPTSDGDSLTRLESFDFCLDAHTTTPITPGSDVDAFCAALALLPALGTVRRLTVHKAPNAYLNLPGAGPSHVLECLGSVIEEWSSLETVDVAFRLPSGPPVTRTVLTTALAQLHVPHQPPNPLAPLPPANAGVNQAQNQNQDTNANRSRLACTRFVSALARAPGLKVVHAHLPAVWNTALLEISTNPSLTAVVLTPRPPSAGAQLFLAAAKRYERLYALIEAGINLSPSSLTPVQSHPPSASARYRSGYAEMQDGASAGRVRAHTTVGRKSEMPFPSASSAEPSSSSASYEAKSSGSTSVGDVGRSTDRDGTTESSSNTTATSNVSGAKLSRTQSKKAKRAARRISVV